MSEFDAAEWEPQDTAPEHEDDEAFEATRTGGRQSRARRLTPDGQDMSDAPRHVPIDVQSLIGMVAKKHNILMRADDPAFVLVTIFEAISARHMKLMGDELNRGLDALTHSAEEQKEASRLIAGRIINQGSDYISEKIRLAGSEMGPTIAAGVMEELKPALAQIAASTAAVKRDRQWAFWSAATAVLACVLTVGFVLVGGQA